MKIKIVLVLFVNIFILSSCSCGHDKGVFNDTFRSCDVLSLDSAGLTFNVVGRMEDIKCVDSVLITYNSGVECPYMAYDAISGKQISNFGQIGHGRNEIPKNSFGTIFDGYYMVFEDASKIMAYYKLSDTANTSSADTVFTYKLDDGILARIVPVDSSKYIGLGTFKDKYHYVLFDAQGHIYDSAYDIFGLHESKMNQFHRFLANQGTVIKHPHSKQFVGITERSGMIDFFSVENNRINKIRSYSDILPSWDVQKNSRYSALEITEQTINGFLDVAGNDDYVFALYSDELVKNDPYKAKCVLVFDWSGNPVAVVDLPYKGEYLAANSTTLFVICDNEKDEQFIGAYKIDRLKAK